MSTKKTSSLLKDLVQISVKVNTSIYAISSLYISKYGTILECCPNKKHIEYFPNI